MPWSLNFTSSGAHPCDLYGFTQHYIAENTANKSLSVMYLFLSMCGRLQTLNVSYSVHFIGPYIFMCLQQKVIKMC